MADSLSPQVPPAPGRMYGADQRRLWRATEQLQRQRVKTQPAPTAASSSAAGAHVYTSTTVGIDWPTGATYLSFGSPSYTVDDVAGMVPLSVTGGNLTVTEDGLYQAWCYVDLRWDSQAEAPGDSLAVYLNGDLAIGGAFYYPVVQLANSTKWGVIQPVSNGPEWMAAGQYWRLEVDGDGPSSGPLYQSGVGWRITRFQ